MADISSRPCGLDFVVGFTDGIRRAEELAVKIDFIMTAAVMDSEHRHHSFRCIYVPLIVDGNLYLLRNAGENTGCEQDQAWLFMRR